jgi:hypothetical protein
MKVFFDIFSNDEIISDSYKMEKVFNNVLGEVKAGWTTKGGDNIDIGIRNSPFLILS